MQIPHADQIVISTQDFESTHQSTSAIVLISRKESLQHKKIWTIFLYD